MRPPIYYFTFFIIVILSDLSYEAPKFPIIDWDATEAPKASGHQPHQGCEAFDTCVHDLRNQRQRFMENTTVVTPKCSEDGTHKGCGGGFISNLHTQNSTCVHLPQVKEILLDQYSNCRDGDLEAYCIDNALRWINRLFTRCTDIKPDIKKDNCSIDWEENGVDGTDEVMKRETRITEFSRDWLVYDLNGDHLINIPSTKEGPIKIDLIAKGAGPINLTIQVCEKAGSICHLNKDVDLSESFTIEIMIKNANEKCPFKQFKPEDKNTYPNGVCRNGIWPVNFTAPKEQVIVERPYPLKGCEMTIRITSANLSKCYLRWDTLFDIDLRALPMDLDMDIQYATNVQEFHTSRNTTGVRTMRTDSGSDEDRTTNDFKAASEFDFNLPIDILELSGSVQYDFNSRITNMHSTDFMKGIEKEKKKEYEYRATTEYDQTRTLFPGYRHQTEVLAIYCTYYAARRLNQQRSFVGDSWDTKITDCGGTVTLVENAYEKASHGPPAAQPESVEEQ